MNYLAIDYGTKKSGLAINVGDIAIPLKIVETPLLINEVQKEIKERGINAIVIGIANHVDGRESKHSKKIQSFKNVLNQKIPNEINIIFHDERYSSFEAKKSFELEGVKKFDAKMLDDIAATIILESYLNSIK